jgi:hypothetical protein
MTLCYELVGLTTGVPIEVTVAAGNNHLSWGLSARPLRLTPLSGPSETPSSPELVSQDAISATFVWTAPVAARTSPTLSYSVLLKRFGTSEWKPSTPASFEVYTDALVGYTIGGILAGYAYSVQVYAVNLAGVKYPPMEYVLPTPVTNLRVDAVQSSCTFSPLRSCSASRWVLLFPWAAASRCVLHFLSVLFPSYYVAHVL